MREVAKTVLANLPLVGFMLVVGYQQSDRVKRELSAAEAHNAQLHQRSQEDRAWIRSVLDRLEKQQQAGAADRASLRAELDRLAARLDALAARPAGARPEPRGASPCE